MRSWLTVAIAAIATFGSISIAPAADLPTKAPVYKAPPAIASSWTGLYVGGNVGYGWGRRHLELTANDPPTAVLVALGALPPIDFGSSGALGGVQLGYNWQFDPRWLAGIETDFDFSGIKGSGLTNASEGGLPVAALAEERIKWFGTIRARLGYLPVDNLLAYVTGGFAYGRVERSGTYVNNSGTQIIGSDNASLTGYNCSPGPGFVCFAGSSSSVATGWTLGGGLEYALWQKWTLKAEYLYVSLNSTTFTETALVRAGLGFALSTFNANGRTNFNVARVGLNYRF